MSNYETDIEDDFEDGAETDLLKELRKANKQKNKQLAEIQAELQALREEKRTRTIKEVLESRGVNPKIASFIPKDIDLNEESLSNWLNEYGDVFGVQQVNQAEQTGLPTEFIDNYKRANATMESAIPADRERLIEAQLREAEKAGPDAVKEVIAKLAGSGL